MAPRWAQVAPPHVPAVSQSRPQQAPARLHSSPSPAHPESEAQASCPLLSCRQRYEQQSSGRWQAEPSSWQSEWPQVAPAHVPEQHSPSLAQVSPSPAQWASVGALANSTSRTHPIVAAVATSNAKTIALSALPGPVRREKLTDISEGGSSA